MAALKGGKRYGGRAKGTPNKKTQTLMELCEQKGINPFEGLIDLALSTLDDGLRFQCHKELCQYLYPKRKALEVSGSMDLELIKRAQEVQALPDVELNRQIVLEAERIKKKK